MSVTKKSATMKELGATRGLLLPAATGCYEAFSKAKAKTFD